MRETVAYLKRHATRKVANRFIDSVQTSLDLLAGMPDLGTTFSSDAPDLANARMWQVKKPFQNYLIYYRLNGAALDVLHVVHGARDLDAIL